MRHPIPLPAPTRARLEQLLKERERVGALIDATILAVREALEVPDGYTIHDLSVGFEAPQEEQPQG